MSRLGVAATVVLAAVAAAVVGVGAALSPPGPAGAAPGGTGGPASTGCSADHFSLEPLVRAEAQAARMVKRMTLRQEVTLLHGVGDDKAPSGAIGATAAIPSLGIPALNEEDGPAGVGDGTAGVTQLPAPEALAATFDPAAAACYGQVIGAEARGKGVNLVYGPTINVVRVPEWGRAFEALGEDPALTGTIGAAEVRGIQRTGTMAQVKHYAVYSQETGRLHDDAEVGTKALQEIYLAPWRTVLEAGPSSVMCAYGAVNGTGNCQSGSLLKGFLDTTLDFPGFVGSDYSATQSTAAAADAGLDQEQPTGTYFGPALVAAVKDGQVSRATVDEAARRVLTEMYRFRLFTDDAKGSIHADVASPGDRAVAEQVAEEGTVLLKDAHQALPLAAGPRGGLAVVGPAAQEDPVPAGGGSATVKASGLVTPLDGIRAADTSPGTVTDAPGLPGAATFSPIPSTALSAPSPTPATPFVNTATLTPPATGTYELAFSEPPYYVAATLTLDGTPVAVNPGTPPRATYTATVDLVAGRTYTLTGPVTSLSWVTPGQIDRAIDQAVAAARKAATAVVVVGDGQESEAADRVGLTLPTDQDALVDAVAAVNHHTVVVVDAGGPVAMPWLGKVSAVVDAWYPGETDGTALAAVLFGRVDPSGHLPLTFPTTAGRTPVATAPQFPGQGGTVTYAEGVDVGYRWYDATGTTPLFPFGFGLSYTTFRFTRPTVRVAKHGGKPEVTATVRVTDTGHRAGADAVQLYLGQPAAAGNPPRQLAAFRRVMLVAGQSTTVTFRLSARQLAYYDTASSSWRVAPGAYRIWLGDSSALADLPARTGFTVARGTTLGR